MKKKLIIEAPLQSTVLVGDALQSWRRGNCQLSYRTSDYLAVFVRLGLGRWGFVCIGGDRTPKFATNTPEGSLELAMTSGDREIFQTKSLAEL